MKTLLSLVLCLAFLAPAGAQKISDLPPMNALSPGNLFLVSVSGGSSYKLTFNSLVTNLQEALVISAVTTNGINMAENLALTNGTTFGVFYAIQGETNLQFFSLKQGTNMVMYRDGSNIVLNASASGGGGGTASVVTNANQFGPSPTLTLKDGVVTTNEQGYLTLQVFGTQFISTNLWVTNKITGNQIDVSVFNANTLTLTNALGSNQVRLAFTNLMDVQVAGRTQGQVPIWDATNAKWTNGNMSASGSGSDTVSNIVVSTTNNVLLDFAAANVFKLRLLTNWSETFTNLASLTRRAMVYYQQDTNGARLLNRFAAETGSQIQTNANMQPTTNANALDLLEVMPGFFTTNLVAWWPQNFQPRIAFTNSLDYDASFVLQLLPSTVSSVGDGQPVATWTDSSPAANSPTAAGTARPLYTANVASTGKKGMLFDGALSSMTLATAGNLDLTGAFTLASWVYTASSANQIIIQGYDPSAPFHGYGLDLSVNVAGKFSVYTDASGRHDNTTSVGASAWHHLAVTVTGGTATFYLDGSADGTASQNAGSTYSGSRFIGGSATRFNGYLRDIRIYSRALTSGEIAAIAAASLD